MAGCIQVDYHGTCDIHVAEGSEGNEIFPAYNRIFAGLLRIQGWPIQLGNRWTADGFWTKSFDYCRQQCNRARLEYGSSVPMVSGAWRKGLPQDRSVFNVLFDYSRN